MSRARLHWPTVAVGLLTLGAWAVALLALAGCRVADAAPTVAWERSYAVGDSLVVPVRWAPSCDLLGCATSYRVTWTWGDPIAAAPMPGATADRAPIAAPVLREVLVTDPRDTVRVPLPAIGQPQTVCVAVVAIRRGLASDARRGCRTVEAPDAPPPPVDSITWDSLPLVEPLVSRLTLDSLSDTLAVLMARWATRTDSSGRVDSMPLERLPRVRVRDSATGLILVPAHEHRLRVGWSVRTCAMIPHRTLPDVAVISVPGSLFQRPSLVRAHMALCADALALDWPERTRIRWVSDAMPGLPHPMPTDTIVPTRMRAPARSGA